MENILSMLIFFPAVAATVGFLIDKDSMRQYGVVVTVVEFVLSLLLWYYFDTNVAGIQFVQSMPLISAYGINYLVGVDGVSLFLIIMITFMTMIALIGLTEKKDVKNLIITMLYLEMTMVGVFVSLDVILFYIFWELTLIPMFYIIGFWGAEKRFYAAIKFFLYTFTGSLVMLIIEPIYYFIIKLIIVFQKRLIKIIMKQVIIFHYIKQIVLVGIHIDTYKFKFINEF